MTASGGTTPAPVLTKAPVPDTKAREKGAAAWPLPAVPGLEELVRKSGTASRPTSRQTEASGEGVATVGESTASVSKCEERQKLQGIQDIEELRHRLVATNADVARLARDLANVREEHDTAIASIGGLMESLAKAATGSIQRIEARFATETKPAAHAQEIAESVASSSTEFECQKETRTPTFDSTNGSWNKADPGHDTFMHCESSFAARRDAIAAEAFSARRDAIVAEVMNLSQVAEHVTGESTGRNAELHEVQVQIASRIASTEARISAAEAVIQADILDLRSLSTVISSSVGRIEADLRPRISALEAVVAGLPRSSSPPRMRTTGVESQGFPRSYSPHRTGPFCSGPGGDLADLGAGHSIQAASGHPGGNFGQEPCSDSESCSLLQRHLSPRHEGNTSRDPTHGMPKMHEQAFLREKLRGIVFSVNQVLGTLNLQNSSTSTESGDAILQSEELHGTSLPSVVSYQAEKQQQQLPQQQQQQVQQMHQPQQQLGSLGRRPLGCPASTRTPRRVREVSPTGRIPRQHTSSNRFQQAPTPPLPAPVGPQAQQASNDQARTVPKWGTLTSASLWDVPVCGSGYTSRVAGQQQQQQTQPHPCNESMMAPIGSPLGSPAVPPPGGFACPLSPRGGGIHSFASPRNVSGSAVAPPHYRCN